MKRHYYLTPVLGGPGAPRYPISEEPQLVGRSERAAIPLLEPTVSREHAAIQYRDSAVYLEDLGSKHGTFVNSKRVSTVKLRVGDIIVFGLSLVLRLEEADRPLPPAPALGLTESGNTVSIVEPISRLRKEDVRVTATARPVAAASVTGTPELDLLREQLTRTRKLAAVGAACAGVLPSAYHRLVDLREELARTEELTSADLIAVLGPVIDSLGRALRAGALAAPALSATSLFDVARRAVAQVQPEAAPKQVDLLLGVPHELRVMADADRLVGALVELLRNAAQASPEGQSVELSATLEGEDVLLSIRDHGTGFPPDLAERIFDPFVTLRSDWRHLGLGLFEARETILAQGGVLTLESAPESGTVAQIALRAAQAGDDAA
ncbi:MAG: FHA domain-containing protein [Deltaproteobacteria bacterium]|nr:FHA domain-containing protein [Deltaproteobacteria bacterium]